MVVTVQAVRQFLLMSGVKPITILTGDITFVFDKSIL